MASERHVPRLRVLIAAFDGLQPSQIGPDRTPTIHRLAGGGVTFARHHAVFPSVTRVNAASMMTGRHPGGHGLLGNTLVIRDWDPHRAIPALAPELRQVAASTGRTLLAPTLGEMLSPHGLTVGTVVGGTSGNAWVQHPEAARVGGAVLHPEFTLPERHHAPMVARCGAWPPKGSPEIGRIHRATDVLLGYLLPDVDPDVALVWFPEPDTSQHAAGVGSPPAVEALAAADAQLGRALDGALPSRRRPRRAGGVRSRILDGRPPGPARGRRPGSGLPTRRCARGRDRGRERRSGPLLRPGVRSARARTVGPVACRATVDRRPGRGARRRSGARAAPGRPSGIGGASGRRHRPVLPVGFHEDRQRLRRASPTAPKGRPASARTGPAVLTSFAASWLPAARAFGAASSPTAVRQHRHRADRAAAPRGDDRRRARRSPARRGLAGSGRAPPRGAAGPSHHEAHSRFDGRQLVHRAVVERVGHTRYVASLTAERR